MLLAHFVPLPPRGLSFPDDAPPDAKVDVGVGEDTVFRDKRPPVAAAGGVAGVAQVVFEHAPCGTVWVRPHWDASPRYCTNANNDGQITVQVTRADGRAACMGVVTSR